MKRTVFWAVIYIAAVVFAATSAYAFPSYATLTGKDCGFCHVDPGGGGTLTDAGVFFRDNTPTGVTASAASATQIDLDWTDNSTAEDGYAIMRSPTGAAGTYAPVGAVAANVTSFTDTGLTPETTYFYRIVAITTADWVSYSSAVSATTTAATTTPPAPPTDLGAAVVSSTQIDLSWIDNSTDETGFRIERAASAGGPWTQIAEVAADTISYQDTGLDPGTTYFYRALAFNDGGVSAYSNVVSATTLDTGPTPPAAPTDLTATAVSSSQIDLSWTDNASDETGFRVERAASASGPFTQIAELAANTTSYQDTGLDASTTYFYQVRAFNGGGNSDFSNMASATTQAPPTGLAAPTDLVATQLNATEIQITWTDNSDNEKGFEIQRALSADGPWTTIQYVGPNVTKYINAGREWATRYFYRARAFNAAGKSDFSNVDSALTDGPPLDPTDLVANAVSSTQIDLSWADADPDVDSFLLERATSEGGPFTQIAIITGLDTTYSNSGLSAGTTYFYRVRGWHDGAKSGYSNVASATTLAAPATPTDLTATAVSTRQIDLAWTETSDTQRGFRIERALSADGPWVLIAAVPGGDRTYSNSGLSPDTTYFYRVRAYNTGVNSGYSNVASATTPAAALPNEPTGLNATAVSPTQIDLGWTDNSTDEKGFQVWMATDAGGPFNLIASLGPDVTSYSKSGLAQSTTYFFQVRAIGTEGLSGFSNIASDTTFGIPTPAAPTNLIGGSGSPGIANLTWVDNADNETKYLVEMATSSEGPFTLIAVLDPDSVKYDDGGLVGGGTYYYRVRAYNGAYSDYSNTVEVNTPEVP